MKDPAAKKFIRLSKKLNTPLKVQDFLKTFKYNKKDTLRSAYSCLKSKEAHCMEAAMLAAAILEPLGYPPLIISFESIDGLDHVIFIFRHKGLWGSIGRSRDRGLHGRAPKFRTLKSLALSYYAPYVDKTGKITAYQLANLDDTKTNWRSSKRSVWKAERYLLDLKHIKVKSNPKKFKELKEAYLKKGPLIKGKYWW